ncbi:MAG: DUF4270 domain-containing protein [Daejeonella sp.]|uniref:DUF4270 domain-containing protein n=1 Tax=Daejeonella sp. TaxID=2805397 RepID=UPI0027324ED7|nr:DUF4270 domain-containing protein [Daejeonella sp.]MDP3467586.1 DUF4270 domain-containing protein [Daejeonella sp.]
MKLYKLDLLTLLISLFILSSCQNTDSIGLDVDPATEVTGSFTDTITVISSTVKEDSLVTNTLTKYPLGYLIDPIFGKTNANIAMSLTLDPPGLNFGTSPVLDSAVLVLYYAKDFYGDSTSNFQVEVHQLNNPLSTSVRYYNTQAQSYGSSVIGSKRLRFNVNDSVRVTEIVTGNPDKQVTRAPQMRIPLNSSFITTNFLNASSTTLSSDDLLNKAVKGFYLTVNKAQSSGPGGIAFFNLSDSSRLEIYYKSQNGALIDTTMHKFPIVNGSVPVIADFKHDYSGTDIPANLNNTSTQQDFTYVQGLAGLRTKIRFPHIEKLKNLGNITINKAELIVSVVGGTDAFKPASRLIMYRTDIANQRQFIPDFSTDPAFSLTDFDFGGFYDSSKKHYKFQITSYIQDIIKGKLRQYDTYIAPVSTDFNRSAGPSVSGSNAGGAVIGSGKSGVSYQMKLRVIYSKIN